MSDLIAVAFEEREEADRVLNELRRSQEMHLVDLEDACVVICDEKGTVQLKQAVDLVGRSAAGGALTGGLFGTLVGLLLLNPLIGLAAGAAFGAAGGAIAGAFSDYGINDDFMRQLGSKLKPNSSALFVLARKVTGDKLLEEVRPYRGEVLYTSLSQNDEARLREALARYRDRDAA